MSNFLPAPPETRLVTIIAHVDHGKTTLADNLLSSNNIISERLAGTIRFLDSLSEEQRRGITMRGKAIALKHTVESGGAKSKQRKRQDYVIHLVDSPGHVDFSAEVTSSLLLCDGALLLVDAVEGMCARTHAVMREAYRHALTPVLVINKIDKLCIELGLSAQEAYERIRTLLECVNAASADMVLRRSSVLEEEEGEGVESDVDRATTIDEEEEIWNFDPCRGNVLFVSAYYGWGFSIPSLAKSLFQNKTLPMKPVVLRKYLFGDFKYHPDTQKITKWTKGRQNNDGVMTMFAQFGLKPIWDVYHGILQAASVVGLSSDASNITSSKKNNNSSKIEIDTPGMETVTSALQIGYNNEEIPKMLQTVLSTTTGNPSSTSSSSASSTEPIARSILRRYRPVSDVVLDAVCNCCPSPFLAQSTLRKNILSMKENPATSDEKYENVQNAIRECNPDYPITVAHVCKFGATNLLSISDSKFQELYSSKEQKDNQEETNVKKSNIILGFTRVLCGTLTSDAVQYTMYGPKYDPAKTSSKKRQSIRLYLIMGSNFIHVDKIPAGHICAVYNLEDLQYKTLTMSDGGDVIMPLCGFDSYSSLRPLVKVNVEPVNLSDSDALERGLLKLSLADASVEVTTTSRGERLLACLGELHLEQSILDLKTMYCPSSQNQKIDDEGMELRISDPIIEFGESTTWFTPHELALDFQSFFDDEKKNIIKPRQISIPPYCDEEGLAYADKGRCRSILGIRGAAISVRCVPLHNLVYKSLKKREAVQGSREYLVQLCKVLNCCALSNADPTAPAKENGAAAENDDTTCEEMLQLLLNSVCALDDNGNAMIETTGIKNGECIKAVISKDDDEVYVMNKTQQNNNGDEITPEKTDKHNIYLQLCDSIRNGGIIANNNSNTSIQTSSSTCKKDEDEAAFHIWKSELRGSAVAGFQLAMRSGPVCEEPCRGVLVVLEGVEIAMKRKRRQEEGDDDDASTKNKQSILFCTAKPISGGMVVAALRSGIRCALLTRPIRIVEGHLRLTLHSSLAGLGPLYAVLSKRRGRVITDSIVEGTDLLLIEAIIPQAESFNLTSELLKKSSGEVTAPELVFSHWDLLDEDPFWVATSLEEREDYGEIAATDGATSSTGISNNALRYIRAVRKRKGLLVDSSKIVVAAEKQRTLARKK